MCRAITRCPKGLRVRQHCLDCRRIGFIGVCGFAVCALEFTCFAVAVQQMAAEGVSALHAAGFCELKAFLRTGMCFDFRHVSKSSLNFRLRGCEVHLHTASLKLGLLFDNSVGNRSGKALVHL